MPVGTVIARLLETGEMAPTDTPERPTVHATAGPPPITGAPTAGPAGVVGLASVATTTAATPAPAGRRQVSPAARRRAAELGVALDLLAGSGPQGAVTIRDVEQAAVHNVPARDRSIEIRRTIASVMTRSKREVPHYYLADEIPLAAAMAWLSAVNAARPVAGHVLMAALYLRAVARAAQQHPLMNGHFIDGTFRRSAAVNLGMAISLRGGGLLAPAISHAESKTIDEIMHALADLVARTRAGTLRREESGRPHPNGNESRRPECDERIPHHLCAAGRDRRLRAGQDSTLGP